MSRERCIISLLLAVLLVLLSSSATLTGKGKGPASALETRSCSLEQAGGRGPDPGSMGFVENRGQFGNDGIAFVHTSPGISFAFVERGYLIRMDAGDDRGCVVKVSFEAAGPVRPEGLEELTHRTNVLRGNDPGEWITDLASYGKVVYRGLYDGIDLVFYATRQDLKYDILVSPGARAEKICFSYEGVDDIVVDAAGDLNIQTPAGLLTEEAPFSYQIVDGRPEEVPSRYRVDGNRVRFGVGTYDPSLPLTIDPLIYSSYLGGSESDDGQAMAVDPSGNIYLTGDTYSSDFPMSAGAYDDSFNGVRDIFVTKMSPDGSELLYSTFVGGGDNDVSRGIAVDPSGNIYVTGRSESVDFPTTSGAYSENHNGDCDVIVFKLSADGSELLYSTFVGGSEYEVGYAGVVVDSGGNAYVAGHTNSPDFPTTPGAYDRTYYAAGWDGFAFKLNAEGSDLVYSTYFGGWDYEGARTIAIDSQGNAYLGGDTTSDDFPTSSGAYDETYNGERDGFLLKLNADGSDLIYSSYLGGSDDELVNALTRRGDGSIWAAGYTFSTNFPTSQGTYDEDINGERDFFISRLDRGGSELLYSSFVGGQSTDEAWGVAVEGDLVYVSGRSTSEDFPVTNGSFDESFNGEIDIIILALDTEASELVYSSYVGGGGREVAWDIEVHDDEMVAMGLTSSDDFPTTSNAYDRDYNGGHVDAVMLKMSVAGDGAGGGGDGDSGDDDGFLPGFALVAFVVIVMVMAVFKVSGRKEESWLRRQSK